MADEPIADNEKKRLLVSRDNRTDVWTDDQGDQWKPYYVPQNRYAEGVWVTFTRSNDWAPVVRCLHSDELDARRCAMRLIDERALVHFVPWDTDFDPDAEGGTK